MTGVAKKQEILSLIEQLRKQAEEAARSPEEWEYMFELQEKIEALEQESAGT